MTSAHDNSFENNFNKPWFATYQCYGISPNIHMPNKDTSLIDILEKTMQNHPNRIASLSMGRAFTYRELDLTSRTVAAYLQALGLVKGDKVAIMLPNVIQYAIVAIAVLRAGLILVNVNPLYTSRELEHQLQDADAKAIFILENFAHTYQAISPTLVEYVIMCRVGDMLGKVKGTLVNFGAKYIKKMVPDWQIKQFSWFSDVLKSNPALYQRPDLTLEDTALLQYTGGTTGVAKGAMLTHGNLIANILQIDALVDTSFTQEEREREHVILTALPLYHVFAFTICCLYVFRMGYTQLLIANPRDLDAMVKDINRYSLTFFIGINTLFNALVHHPKFREADFAKLKVTIAGGMSVNSNVAEEWHRITDTIIVEGYGLSECSPVVAFNPIRIEHFTGKIGIPASSTDVVLLDDDERPVALGERGEIAVKGPQVMKGYHNAPTETLKAFSKTGYFKTGDIGVMDDKGFIKLVDRKKEMILVSGFNVYPNEIEEVIMQHPDILECGVIGVPSDSSGEVPKVFAVRKNSQLTEQALLNYAKENLTGYKRPRKVEFVDSLPKSAVGKVLRKELRALEKKK